MDAALASGSHGVAFRPRGLDRSADAIQQAYRRHRIDFPPQFAWYTDGGTIDNQPLGRALDLTSRSTAHRTTHAAAPAACTC